jgi:two-component system response regulator VanR
MNKSEKVTEGFSPADQHILIVEDSATQALQLELLLKGSGYSVSRCADGGQALAFLKQQETPPDLVISDIVMPSTDGYTLCEQIRADERFGRMPVLLLSTLSEPEDIIRGLSCGANNFLTKPYEAAELLDRVNYMLINSKLRAPQREEVSVEVFFNGKKHTLPSDRFQILDLLFSTYDNVLKQKRELELMNRELRAAHATIDTLQGILPICSGCKKIKDQNNQWQLLEKYISERSDTQFSHGLCPDCVQQLYPDVYKKMLEKK